MSEEQSQGMFDLPKSKDQLIKNRVYDPTMSYYTLTQVSELVLKSQAYDLTGINEDQTRTLLSQFGSHDQVMPIDIKGFREGDLIIGFSYVPYEFEKPLSRGGEYVIFVDKTNSTVQEKGYNKLFTYRVRNEGDQQKQRQRAEKDIEEILKLIQRFNEGQMPRVHSLEELLRSISSAPELLGMM